jgi:hypothetical protein
MRWWERKKEAAQPGKKRDKRNTQANVASVACDTNLPMSYLKVHVVDKLENQAGRLAVLITNNIQKLDDIGTACKSENKVKYKQQWHTLEK